MHRHLGTLLPPNERITYTVVQGAKRTQQQVTTAPCDHETSEETETKEKPHKTKRRKEDPSEDVETKIVVRVADMLATISRAFFTAASYVIHFSQRRMLNLCGNPIK